MSIDHGKLLALSPEAIEAGWRATFSTDNPFCPCDLKTFAKAARWAERALAQPAEAVPNDDAGIDAVVRHGLFVYEVDFGDEGKGRYIRLRDFNAVVRKLEQPAEAVEAQVAEAAFKAGAIAMADRLIDRLAEEADGCSIESPQAKAYYAALDARKSHDAAQGAVADVPRWDFEQHADGQSLKLYPMRVADGRWVKWSDIQNRAFFEALVRSKEGTHPQAAPAQGDGVGLIAAERRRQVEAEGWTPEHDDVHTDGSLAVAAACYATQANQGLYENGNKARDAMLRYWPWDAKWWKPTPQNRIRELVKAGALIAAEIDRLQRAAAPSQEGE